MMFVFTAMKGVRRVLKWFYDLFPNHGKNNEIKGITRNCLIRGGGIWGDNNSLVSQSPLGGGENTLLW